jgi:hypothetical protein
MPRPLSYPYEEMTEYTTSILSVIVKPPADRIFSEMATTISIDDESGGEFVVVRQNADRLQAGEIQITPEEWPSLRSAINKMVMMCRD